MFGNRVALVLAALMCVASVGAVALRPSTKAAKRAPAINLETMVPKRFGDWHEEPLPMAQVVNPETKQMLDRLYSQILNRTYVNSDGNRIMLSVAYGSDQRDEFQAHKPEVCYPAQGFSLHSKEAGTLATPFGDISVTRLQTSMGERREPVTYWFTVGDSAIENKIQKRLVELRYGLTGEIPDGMLFRVSSIDGDPSRAFRLQNQFVIELLEAVSPADRVRLSGLGNHRALP
jgi:EpsI family protein